MRRTAEFSAPYCACLPTGLPIQAHHVAQLLDEERVRGQLEALLAMRLQAKHLEVARHAAFGDAHFIARAAHAPVRCTISRLDMQRRVDQAGQCLIVDRARSPGPQIVVQPFDAQLDEARAPLSYRGRVAQNPWWLLGLSGVHAAKAQRPAIATRSSTRRTRGRRHVTVDQIAHCQLLRTSRKRAKALCEGCGVGAGNRLFREMLSIVHWSSVMCRKTGGLAESRKKR